MAVYIEVGNTNVKVMDEKMLIHSLPTSAYAIEHLADITSGASEAVVTGVVPDKVNNIALYFKNIGKRAAILNNRSRFSFKHNVDGVGVDRLIAVEGALTLMDPPFIVIDAGTAITVDFVIKQDGVSVFKGGVIIPGFELCFKALNDYTCMLPRLKPMTPKGTYGQDTMNAMNCGICLTLSSGIKHIINTTELSFGVSNMPVVITGGAGKFMGELLNSKHEYVENLIFRGMMNIYNSTKGE